MLIANPKQTVHHVLMDTTMETLNAINAMIPAQNATTTQVHALSVRLAMDLTNQITVLNAYQTAINAKIMFACNAFMNFIFIQMVNAIHEQKRDSGRGCGRS